MPEDETKNIYHRAVVVGISQYPGYDGKDLVCPGQDAVAFREWLVDPAGGNVPEENIQMVIVPPAKRKMSKRSAKPTEKAIHEAIKTAYQDAGKVTGAEWNQSRLYLFLSGHGISLRTEDASLLAADASDDDPGRHVSSSAIKDFFQKEHYFREIVVFADCCRDDFVTTTNLNMPTWKYGAEVGDGEPEIFILCGARFGKQAHEERTGPKEERLSYFTRCLLETLHGDPVAKAASKGHLSDFDVYNQVKGLYVYLDENARGGDSKLGKVGVTMVNPGIKFGMTGKPRTYLTEITANKATAVRVRGNGEPIDLTPNGKPGVFSARLPKGTYEVELAAKPVGGEKNYRLHPDFLVVFPGYNERTYELS